ncbi:hypothetical protein CDL15_Pgr011865 [Punica granatum]|uniref:Uncharacterized protein n=1 Tax=Punica granatum TaxID=22663 RepID=A0A218XE11_PUNGR|nr:hypothetical protein CDL15_Pgr011865 [Punica granatum]PKH53882.1 hypothetical protein CRG98_050327 [Punica granatum]
MLILPATFMEKESIPRINEVLQAEVMPTSTMAKLNRIDEDLMKTGVTISDFKGAMTSTRGVLSVDIQVGSRLSPRHSSLWMSQVAIMHFLLRLDSRSRMCTLIIALKAYFVEQKSSPGHSCQAEVILHQLSCSESWITTMKMSALFVLRVTMYMRGQSKLRPSNNSTLINYWFASAHVASCTLVKDYTDHRKDIMNTPTQGAKMVAEATAIVQCLLNFYAKEAREMKVRARNRKLSGKGRLLFTRFYSRGVVHTWSIHA